MAIQYPGGTIVSTTFTGATKNNIVTNLQTQLNNAGWTTISGGGTGDVILESATTPTASNLIRVRLRDSAATNCAVINMQNAAASKVSQNYYLLPAALKTFRVLANKYQFFCFTPGASAAREFVGCGVPYIPSFLHSVITGEFGWISGNATSDTDTAVPATSRATFRTHLHCSTNGQTNWFSGLVNSNLCDSANGTTAGALKLMVPVGGYTADSNAGNYRWHDDSLQLCDPLVSWGLTANSDEAKIRGQLWGAMVVTDSFAADTTFSSVDGHDWWGITNSQVGNTSNARGSLFIATT